MIRLEPLTVIVGPTAVGKTDVGIAVARKTGGEVISGDSMQIYKYMDIGTAKPSKEEMNGVPHYMIDILTPDEDFSAARFQAMVTGCIRDIRSRGKLPVIVGGTGLYIRSVIDHYDFSPPGGEDSRRDELYEQAEIHGNEYLVRKLKEVDPASADRIHENDTRRLVRALEVFYTTGRPISDFQYGDDQSLPPKYNLVYFGLTMERQRLYERIENRVDTMISRGLVDEVKMLVEMGYGPQSTAMQALGYKEILGYLDGLYSLEEAVEIIKRDTRRFAKRQLTWFRRDKRIRWLDVELYNSLQEIADKISAAIEGQFANM